jgi:SAM-dependent methyltransferase
MDDNDITLKSYDDHIQEYVDGTPHTLDAGCNEWLDEILESLPRAAEILELGSGFGADADYIEAKGHKVIRTDASRGFVKLLKEQGHDALILNALTDDLGNNRVMIFANAVFLHFNRQQLADVLLKTYSSLRPGGILAFSLKEGDGESWTNEKLSAPRYFCYWRSGDIQKAVEAAGFKDIKIISDTTSTVDWLNITALKI